MAWLVFRHAGRLMLIGCGIGLAVSLGAARMITSAFYQVRPFEPLVFAAVLVLMLPCGAAASLGPARRAVRMDPIRALRCE